MNLKHLKELTRKVFKFFSGSEKDDEEVEQGQEIKERGRRAKDITT